jgi:hypothetical protein
MRNWSIGLKDGQARGTFTEFLKELEGIYGDKDEKEGARKELKILFETKDLSNMGVPKFIEKFKVLAQLAELEDAHLIKNFKACLPEHFRGIVIGWEYNLNTPQNYLEYANAVSALHKNMYPDDHDATILGIRKSGGGSDKMEVDAISKKGNKKERKGKGKAQQANNIEGTSKFCHICKKSSHNTDDCWQLAKNADRKPGARKEENKQPTSGSKPSTTSPSKLVKIELWKKWERLDANKVKKIRAIIADIEDEEANPQYINTASGSKIEELQSDFDERSESSSFSDNETSERKVKPQQKNPGQGFVIGTM